MISAGKSVNLLKQFYVLDIIFIKPVISENIPLKKFNAFGIDVKARQFMRIASVDDLYQLMASDEIRKRRDLLVLGSGSNILFTCDYEGLVVKMDIQGILLEQESEDECLLRVYAGHSWDDLVRFSVERGLGGIENLSLIPGTAGAAPIQNIGAYGAELKDVLQEVQAIDRMTGQMVTLPKHACGFGYRTSIFKTTDKHRYIITSIALLLHKRPVLNTAYKALNFELSQVGVTEITPAVVRRAVISIRRRKLPDPSELGNAGSFFKNPDVPSDDFYHLQRKFPDIVAYPQAGGRFKLAAGWMIEQCRWKGYRKGDAGVHDRQALVLVNFGHATGEQLLQLAEEIRSSVMKRFGVMLENEVNVV